MPPCPHAHATFAIAFALTCPLVVAGCTKEEKSQGSAPPPSAAPAPKEGICASGGGEVGDPISAAFFPRQVTGYCIDPQGQTRTYGEKAKLSMDEVCTTAFDGECEVYKRFGLKRVVALHYVDSAGKGGSAEVYLSQFGGVSGAYGMFTKRVVADGDPSDPAAPKPLAAGAAGAIGTGRAYIWKGSYLIELQYINEVESPEQLARSSEGLLSELGKEIGKRLPGDAEKPASAAALPSTHRLPNGVQFYLSDLPGFKLPGPAAVGFYRDGAKRYRLIAAARDDADQAKDVLKAVKARQGASSVAGLGDEAVQVSVQADPARPAVEYLFSRKGPLAVGVADEEFVADAEKAAAKLTKEEKSSRLRAWLSEAAAGAGAAAPAGDAGKATVTKK